MTIPTFNEADNLPVMAAELWALGIPELSIMVIDDNSPDGTGDVALKLSKRHPGKLFVLNQPGDRDLGRAYIAGFKWALNQGADYVIQMDCDFSHSPRHIPEMLEAIQNVDVVVGSRYIEGGKLDERWGFGRYLASWWANGIYLRLILNLHVKDATSGFKCWRASTLQAIDLDAIHSSGYSFQFEMAYITEKLGFKVLEIPIYFEDRRIGSSKLSMPAKIEAALRTWEFRWRYRNYIPTETSSVEQER